jgi:hypothetical protein
VNFFLQRVAYSTFLASRKFDHAMFKFMFLFIFVIICCVFEWEQICTGFIVCL